MELCSFCEKNEGDEKIGVKTICASCIEELDKVINKKLRSQLNQDKRELINAAQQFSTETKSQLSNHDSRIRQLEKRR
jgi:hypothetical protein